MASKPIRAGQERSSTRQEGQGTGGKEPDVQSAPEHTLSRRRIGA